jgi:hypothetical protein
MHAAPALTRLATAWVEAFFRARHAEHEQRAEADVLAPFLLLLTGREPHRTQALDEVRLFVASHLPTLLGCEVRVSDPPALEAFGPWAETLHPLTFELSGALTMDGVERDGIRVSIARIGREDGVWRVIQVFDEASRARATLEAQLRAIARAQLARR